MFIVCRFIYLFAYFLCLWELDQLNYFMYVNGRIVLMNYNSKTLQKVLSLSACPSSCSLAWFQDILMLVAEYDHNFLAVHGLSIFVYFYCKFKHI